MKHRRYIDANALKKEIKKHAEVVTDSWSAGNWYALSVSKVITLVEYAPTADVVEVVRCKDCKHCEWYIRAHYKNGIEVESHECRKYKMAVTRDWFCADGERRDDVEIH